MPGIFEAKCDNCGKGPETSGSLAGWEAKEMPEGGKSFSDPYLALKLDDGKFLGLPHPGERRHLEGRGYKWDEVSRQGRLYGVRCKVCRQCGLVHEEAQVTSGTSWGCFGAIALGVVCFVLLKAGTKVPWLVCGMIGLSVMVGVAHIVDLREGWRWREVNGKLKLIKCSGCGGRKFVTFLEAMRKKSLPCPFCKTKTMRYLFAGKS
jgi:hypothetical protein